MPYSLDESIAYYSPLQRKWYTQAFENDIVNILAGPLAEAKYFHQASNSSEFSQINLASLQSYGGEAGLHLVSDYMTAYAADEDFRRQKLAGFYYAAFRFVDNQANWKIISDLAEFLLGQSQARVSCEEIGTFLESR